MSSDWISTIQRLIEGMVASNVTELEVSHRDLRVRLSRNPHTASLGRDGVVPQPSLSESVSLHSIVAPLTGIYYATANPSGKPFVTVGEWVEQDTVIGLIEAMKVFNEITADCRGRVTAVLAKQGQLMQAGEAVLLVDTAEESIEGNHE